MKSTWGANSTPQVPVQSAVVHRFEDAIRIDFFQTTKVGQCTGHFQDAVMGAGTEVHITHGLLHESARLRIQLAVPFDEPRRHGAVGVNAFQTLEALDLDLPSLFDTQANACRRLRWLCLSEGSIFHQRHLHM